MCGGPSASRSSRVRRASSHPGLSVGELRDSQWVSCGPLPIGAIRHPVALGRFGVPALLPVAALARRFHSPVARALIAGCGAHSFLPLHAPMTSGLGLALLVSAHAVGWPIPRGGAGRIVDALASTPTGRHPAARVGGRGWNVPCRQAPLSAPLSRTTRSVRKLPMRGRPPRSSGRWHARGRPAAGM